MLTSNPWTQAETAAALRDARRRTLELVADLDDGELVVPRLVNLSPFLWELGRVAWFQERWLLRRHGEPAPRADADAIFGDAATHGSRWDAPLPTRKETLGWLEQSLERALARLARVEVDDDERYYHQLVLAHEDACAESLTRQRQTLGLPAPRPTLLVTGAPVGGPCPGDAAFGGGPMLLGAEPERRFVHDDEKWSHAVDVRPLRIARAPVTQAEFASFVAESGYERGEFWSDVGWRWRQREHADTPLYWERDGAGNWLCKRFDRMVELAPDLPMMHVNAHEAEAYCRFAARALPTEAEWEFAAGWLMRVKKPFPWGWKPFEPELANLDGLRIGPVDVGAFPLGDSVHGCRQMLGNVWEWTASALRPYPGFERGHELQRASPHFGRARVLRGGSFATRAREARTTARGFADPERRDLFAGFRTVEP